MNEAGYQTLIVKFSKPITELDGIFDDAGAWGVETLKGWIEAKAHKQCLCRFFCFIYTGFLTF